MAETTRFEGKDQKMALYRIVTHGVFASLILCAALFNTVQAMSDTNGTSGATESCNPPLFLTQSWPNTDFQIALLIWPKLFQVAHPKMAFRPLIIPASYP